MAEALLKGLRSIRDVAEDARLACARPVDDTWSAVRGRVSDANRDAVACDLLASDLFNGPDSTLECVRPFLMSMGLALICADSMFARHAALSQPNDLKDVGHQRLIQKHLESSRREIAVFCREAREAAHVAQFIIQRIDGVRHAKSA